MEKLFDLLKNSWFSIAGWALALGFVINCAVAPYLDVIQNSWGMLIGCLTILLAWKGAEDSADKDSNKRVPRHWIVVIGWSLFVGLVNNGIVHLFYELNTVDWFEMLTALAFLLTVSASRDNMLKKKGVQRKRNSAKRLWIPFCGVAISVSLFIMIVFGPFTSLIREGWELNTVDWYYISLGIAVVGGIGEIRNRLASRAKTRGSSKVADKMEAEIKERDLQEEK